MVKIVKVGKCYDFIQKREASSLTHNFFFSTGNCAAASQQPNLVQEIQKVDQK